MMQTATSPEGPQGTSTLHGVRLGGSGDPVDIAVTGTVIDSIVPSRSDGGGLVMPLMSEIHVHLDKTFTVERTGGSPSSLFDAIDLIRADVRHWTEDDIRARATRALEKAWRHGVGAMRSHVDWVEPQVPPTWNVLNEIRQEWRGRVELQLVALMPIDLFPEAGADAARRVRADDGVLGAFAYRNDALEEKIRYSFELAERHDLPLDFHVDEGLEPEARGFEAIVAEAERRTVRQVLCGHVCSLSVQDPDGANALLHRAAAAGVGLVALPTTNSYLQDRSAGRTPRLRGLAPIKEARATGMDVMLASDNVADVFYPYGDYDLVDVFRLGVFAGHLDPRSWLDAITDIPARWLGACSDGLVPDAPADFVHFQATDLRDLLSRPDAERRVWRAGTPIESERKDRP